MLRSTDEENTLRLHLRARRDRWLQAAAPPARWWREHVLQAAGLAVIIRHGRMALRRRMYPEADGTLAAVFGVMCGLVVVYCDRRCRRWKTWRGIGQTRRPSCWMCNGQ